MQKKRVMMMMNLIFMAGVIIVYLILCKPLAADIETLSADLEIIKMEYTAKQNRIETLKSLEEKINTAKAEIENLSPLFYSDMDQEDLIVIINSLCKASEVRLLEIDYSGTSEYQSAEAAATIEAEEDGADSVKDFSLYGDVFAVTFTGTYEKIINMLHLIDSNEKIIVNSGLEISKDISASSYVLEGHNMVSPREDLQKIILKDGTMTCKIHIVFFQMENAEGYDTGERSILEEERERLTIEDPFKKYMDKGLE